MSEPSYTVQEREKAGKGESRRLRREGLNPGIIYGKGTPVKVSMQTNTALRFIDSFRGMKKPFKLAVDTGKGMETKLVILQDVQLSSWGGRLLHVDFREIDKDTKLRLDIPIVTVGVSKAVKLGGVLQMIRHTIPVICTMDSIPEKIEVDITNLNFSESIHVLDFPYPEGVTPVVKGRNFTIMTIGAAGKASDDTEEKTEATEEEVK